MKRINEVWKDGVLISRTESDDGIPTLKELADRVKKLEEIEANKYGCGI